MVLIDSDLKLVKSANTVSGISSLGGAPVPTLAVSESVNDLWDMIKDTELSSTVVGEYEVRCIYVYNDSPTNELMEDVWVWVEQQTVSPYTDVDIALGTAPVGETEQTVADENSLPLNVFWTFARNEQEALLLGNIPKGDGKSLWIRRHAGPARSSSSTPSDNYILSFKVKKTTGPGGGGGGPTPGLDPFGVRQIYATNTSASVSTPFYMDMDNPYNDCRFNTSTGQTATRNSDGSYSLGISPRIRMFTDVSGCARSVIYDAVGDTYDHDIWGDREYMYRPNDWKNVELTGYFRAITVDPANTADRKIYLYSRTWRHNTNVAGGCAGSAYKGVIYSGTGELKWHKEQFHNGAQPCGDRNIEVSTTGVPRTDGGEWFGMKVMMWNYVDPNTGITYVHLEHWLDINANQQWVKMAERNDTGGWYAGMPDTSCAGDEYCGGHQDQIIKWGGPISEVRWDEGFTNVAFKWLSVREIIPGEVVVTPEPPPEPPRDEFGILYIYASKSGGDSWASTAWGNGVNRSMDPPTTACILDSEDDRFSLSGVGDPRGFLTGNGILKATTKAGLSGSPRFVVSGDWQNVETTIYFRCIGGFIGSTDFNLRPKSDHYCPSDPDAFGGYIIEINLINQTMACRREETHNIGYASSQNITPCSLPSDAWIGLKAICYNTGSNVKLEAYRDTTGGINGGTWTKITEATDDGTWPGGGGGTPIFQGVHHQVVLRTDMTSVDAYVEYKWFTAREIEPPT